MPRRRAAVLFAVLLAVLTAQLGYGMAALPDRIASHFDMRGHADGWSSRSSFAAVMLALIALIAGLFGGLRWLLPRLPDSLINLPHKDYWLAPARRQASLRRLSDAMLWIGAATLGLMAAVLWLTIEANLTESPPELGATVEVAVAVYLAAVLVFVVAICRMFRRPPDVVGPPA